MRDVKIIRASAEPAGLVIPRVQVTIETVQRNEDGTSTYEYSFDAGFAVNRQAIVKVDA